MNIKTANRLCELRKKHGLSQEELADKLGVSRQAISKWERSESSPDTDNLIELAKLYNISLDELINDDKDVDDIIQENKEADKQASQETTHIGLDGIHVVDSDGSTVDIDKSGIHVVDEDGEKVNVNIGGIHINDKKKNVAWMSGITGTYALVVVLAYILLGIFAPGGFGWGYWWFLFITIPVPGSIIEAIVNKNPNEFLYPVFVTALFCALGMFLNLWHPMWVLFVSIPAYYSICNLIFRNRD